MFPTPPSFVFKPIWDQYTEGPTTLNVLPKNGKTTTHTALFAVNNDANQGTSIRPIGNSFSGADLSKLAQEKRIIAVKTKGKEVLLKVDEQVKSIFSPNLFTTPSQPFLLTIMYETPSSNHQKVLQKGQLHVSRAKVYSEKGYQTVQHDVRCFASTVAQQNRQPPPKPLKKPPMLRKRLPPTPTKKPLSIPTPSKKTETTVGVVPHATIKDELEYLRLVHRELHWGDLGQYKMLGNLPVKIYEEAIETYKRQGGVLKENPLSHVFWDVSLDAKRAAKKAAQKEAKATKQKYREKEVEYPPWVTFIKEQPEAAADEVKQHFTSPESVNALALAIKNAIYPSRMSLTAKDKTTVLAVISYLQGKGVTEFTATNYEGDHRVILSEFKELVEGAKIRATCKDKVLCKRVKSVGNVSWYEDKLKIKTVQRKPICDNMAFVFVNKHL